MPRFDQSTQNTKKRKAEHNSHGSSSTKATRPAAEALDTSKPTANFRPTKPRKHTLSVALPGSIIANAQSHDQKTHLAGSLARAFAVFCVDEVIIFDDAPAPQSRPRKTPAEDPTTFLSRLLSYLETPPYLRKTLFPMHADLRTAGSLPSLDMPHHLRSGEWMPYREGVTLGPPSSPSHGANDSGASEEEGEAETLVDAGLHHPLSLPLSIPPHTRVTLRLPPIAPERFPDHHPDSTHLTPEAVAPSAPREEGGWYWGYTVRTASCLSSVFTESPWENGYDVSIGTSERGVPLTEVLSRVRSAKIPGTQPADCAGLGDDERLEFDLDEGNGGIREELRGKLMGLRNYGHLVLVFGGVGGLEMAVGNDPVLGESGVGGAREVFDWWVSLLGGQGSRTVRTEEAVWLGLMGVREVVEGRGKRA